MNPWQLGRPVLADQMAACWLLARCLPGELAASLAGLLAGKLAGYLAGQLADQVAGELTTQLAGELAGALGGQLGGPGWAMQKQQTVGAARWKADIANGARRHDVQAEHVFAACLAHVCAARAEFLLCVLCFAIKQYSAILHQDTFT